MSGSGDGLGTRLLPRPQCPQRSIVQPAPDWSEHQRGDVILGLGYLGGMSDVGFVFEFLLCICGVIVGPDRPRLGARPAEGTVELCLVKAM